MIINKTKQMGNNPQKGQKDNKYESYTLIRQEEVTALGKSDIYNDSATNKYYLVFESNYSITNPELAESEITQLRKLDNVRNSCSLIEQSVGKSQMLCFDNYNITLTFEYYEDSFASIIKSKGANTLHDENDIWMIINDIVNYLLEMSNYGLTHGDLQPKNILFNKNRVVKIICPLIYTTYLNAYRLRLANDDYHSTFSPELLQNHQHRNISPDYDPVRSDIFSLGICLLSYIHSEPYENFYDFKNNTINFDKIKFLLSELIRLKYSEELFYFINYCLKQSFYERGTIEMLLKVIASKKQNLKNQYWQ
jgi:serine/threonine protein kinase